MSNTKVRDDQNFNIRHSLFDINNTAYFPQGKLQTETNRL